MAAAAVLLVAPAVAYSGVAALQPDGSVLALVAIEDRGFAQRVVVDVRPDGAVDFGFGHRGALRSLRSNARMAVLPDGRVRVMVEDRRCHGEDEDFECDDEVHVDRFGAVGEREGSSLLVVSEGPGAFGIDLAAAGDGLLALTSEGVHRLLADGSPDPAAPDPVGAGVLVRPRRVHSFDGDALVVTAGGLLALQPDGSPRPGYGDGGRVDTGELEPRAAAPLGGGAVAVTGPVDQPETTNVVRVRPDGTLDPAFAGDGRAEVDAGGGRRIRAAEIAHRAAGR